MRITDFPELIAPTGNDLLVTVDIANDLTKKVKLDNLPISLPALTALATKQDSLVSGTNIKTINSTSLLGSGNITISASPSGVAGAIQFSNGSAFASDAANLFWDDTNNRLGVGTNAPISPLNIQSDTPNVGILSVTTSGGGNNRLEVWNTNSVSTPVWNIGIPTPDTRIRMYTNITLRTNGIDAAVFSSSEANFGSISGARVGIKGSGSTSATTSLLVQNSAGTQGLKITDDSGFQIGFLGASGVGYSIRTDSGGGGIPSGINTNFNNGATWIDDSNTRAMQIPYNGGVLFANTTRYPITIGSATKAVASAQLEMVSTTQGFLPPRMTTTQKNAIASPAAGLQVFDTTFNQMSYFNGTVWINF